MSTRLVLVCVRCMRTKRSFTQYTYNYRHGHSKSKTEDYPAETASSILSEFKKEDDISRFVRYDKILTNDPFVKNLFLGKFDKKMLEFPEFSNNEELNTLNKFVEVLQIVVKEKVDSWSIDKDGKIPQSTMDALQSVGLFGLQVPEEYGGLNITATKYSRLSEVTAVDSSVGITLAAHQAFALAGLIKYGSDEQKSRYLPELAAGRQLAAFCLTERGSGSDVGSAKTTATQSADGSVYYINGHKTWVVNGGVADVLVVFAKTPIVDDTGTTSEKLTGFIVEEGYDGVKSSPAPARLGVRGADISEVTFDNTPVPAANILGQKGQGFKIAMNILNSGRYTKGSHGCGLVKKMIDDCVEHVTTRKQFGKTLQNYKLIKDKLATLAINAYAMESVTYLTTLNLDKYESPDISVEAAIVKVFSSETLWSCMNEVMNIFGAAAYNSDLPYERYLRDSRVNLVFEGTNDILRLYIALAGLQHAGKELESFIKQRRNPLDYPGVFFTHQFRSVTRKYQYPALTLHLNEEVHPSLKVASVQLETNVHRLKFVVHQMLTRHGNEIFEEQTVLRRLADVAILLYTMTACIARSSRSMCIGLPNHDDEILMTNILCFEASRKMYELIGDLMQGPNINMDSDRLLIADKMLKQHKYTPTHPLERNW